MASLTRRTEAQTEKRAAVETLVLEATEALLGEGRSYAELKIEEIATRAGISRTAFYFYFRDKRELLMRLTEDVADALYAEADAWWSGGDGSEGLERALANVIALYREHGVLLRAVVEASAYDEAVAPPHRGGAGTRRHDRRGRGGDRLRPDLDDRAGLLRAPGAGRRPHRRLPDRAGARLGVGVVRTVGARARGAGDRFTGVARKGSPLGCWARVRAASSRDG